jgi:DNA polymerase I-like protein with 3'-5' exonuclease and polymerase domains
VSFLPKNTTPNGRSIWDEGTRSMQRLHTSWLDRSELRIQPLHQVHDSLIGQFKFEDKDWAISKLKEYFNNEIQIAKTKLTIPFAGTYGPNWGDQPFPIK